MSLILKTLAIVGVGAILWTAVQHVREAPAARPVAAASPRFSAAVTAPIPGLDPDPHRMSENLHRLDGKPNVTVLDTSAANAAAAESRSHQMDLRLEQYSPTASPIAPPRR